MVDFLAVTLVVAASPASLRRFARSGSRFFSEGVLPVRYQKKNRSNCVVLGKPKSPLRYGSHINSSPRYDIL